MDFSGIRKRGVEVGYCVLGGLISFIIISFNFLLTLSSLYFSFDVISLMLILYLLFFIDNIMFSFQDQSIETVIF